MGLSDREYANMLRLSAEVVDRHIMPALHQRLLEHTIQTRNDIADLWKENEQLKRRLDTIEVASQIRFKEMYGNQSVPK